MGCAALPGGKPQPSLRRMENPYAPTHPEIRDAIRQLCLKFDGAYWRELDRERGYPTAFVKALTEAGWLATLIPEEYGGGGACVSPPPRPPAGGPRPRVQAAPPP